MTSLIFLWDISLLLCSAAALALAALLLARVIAERRSTSREDARRWILPMLISEFPPVAELDDEQLALAAELTCELAELTRGSARDDLLRNAVALGVPGLLERRLHARSAQQRLNAVETLSAFDGWSGQVAEALDDRNPDVRLGAALALAQRGQSPDIATLIGKLRVGEEENSLLLVSLMADLAEHDGDAVAALLFDREQPYVAKVAATDALANSGGKYAGLLAVMAKETADEPDLQPRIFRALGRSGHPESEAAILAGLSSNDWRVRTAAAEAAGRMRLGSAIELLARMLDDHNWWVRFRASEALLRLGPGGMNALWRASEGESEPARATARAMLSEARAS